MAWFASRLENMVGQMFWPAIPASEDFDDRDEEEILNNCENKEQKSTFFDSQTAVIQDGADGLKKIYEETLQACQVGGYLNARGECVNLPKIESIRMEVCAPIQRSSFYIGSCHTRFEVVQEDALTLACRLKEEGNNAGVLVMSNFIKPFEGIEQGYESEEINIGRRSCLVPLLRQLQYPRSQSTTVFIDLPVFRDKEYRFMEKPVGIKCVVSCPDEYREVTKKSIEALLDPFARKGCTHLVLGDIGYRSTGTSLSDTTRFFKEVIIEQFFGCFESITFSILNKEGSEESASMSEYTLVFQALCANINQLHS